MHKLKKIWHAVSHASVVVWLWDIFQLSISPAVAFMTFMAAVGQDIPLAYVITSTVISLGASVWFLNQVAILLGRPLIVRSAENYSYGLLYEGVACAFDPKNDDASLQVIVKLGNGSRGPLRYKVERFDVVVGNRAISHREYLRTGFKNGFKHVAGSASI